jgi:hypothetical protein
LALEGAERAGLGEEHPDTFIYALLCWGEFWRRLGGLGEAEVQFRRVLERRER